MKDIAAIIKNECAPFLTLLQNEPQTVRFLYRAASKGETNCIQLENRRDRKPKNMPSDLHEAGDEWFSSHFGVRFRGASVFCFGTFVDAEQYASSDKKSVFAIFPVESFQFCWSTKSKDIYEHLGKEEVHRMTPEEYKHMLDELDYRETDLLAAIDSGNEVMLACKNYYAVELASFEQAEQLWRELM